MILEDFSSAQIQQAHNALLTFMAHGVNDGTYVQLTERAFTDMGFDRTEESMRLLVAIGLKLHAEGWGPR